MLYAVHHGPRHAWIPTGLISIVAYKTSFFLQFSNHLYLLVRTPSIKLATFENYRPSIAAYKTCVCVCVSFIGLETHASANVDFVESRDMPNTLSTSARAAKTLGERNISEKVLIGVGRD